MAIEWQQKQEYFANSGEGHFLKVQPMAIGPGYSATMNHISPDTGLLEVILIPNKDGVTGVPFETVEEAKAAAELFLEGHLITPLAEREARLAKIISSIGTRLPVPEKI